MSHMVLAALRAVVRRRFALVVAVFIPALLVLLVASAFDRFGQVLDGQGMPSTGHDAGHGHGHDHFGVLSTLWGAGIAGAMVGGLALTESARFTARVLERRAARRWALARLISLLVLVVAISAFTWAVFAVRGGDADMRVLVATVVVGVVYLAVAHLAAAATGKVLPVVAVVCVLWIIDALTAPSMGEVELWRLAVSPLAAIESWAMRLPVTESVGISAAVWILVAICVLCAPALRAGGQGRESFGSRPRVTARAHSRTRTRRSSPIRTLGSGLVLDLVRNPTLTGFVVLGPLGLMASSLWLFQDVSLGVPAMHDGHRTLVTVTMPHLHAAYMSMISVFSFCGTAGVLIAQTTFGPDAAAIRLRPAVRWHRLAALSAISPIVTCGSLVLVPLVASPRNWWIVVLAHLLGGWTTTVAGYAVGLLLEPVAAVLVAVFYPFVDVGIAQDYMLGPTLPDWAPLLIGHPFAQLAVSGALGEALFDTRYVLWATAVLAAVMVVAVLAVRHAFIKGARRSSLST